MQIQPILGLYQPILTLSPLFLQILDSALHPNNKIAGTDTDTHTLHTPLLVITFKGGPGPHFDFALILSNQGHTPECGLSYTPPNVDLF